MSKLLLFIKLSVWTWSSILVWHIRHLTGIVFRWSKRILSLRLQHQPSLPAVTLASSSIVLRRKEVRRMWIWYIRIQVRFLVIHFISLLTHSLTQSRSNSSIIDSMYIPLRNCATPSSKCIGDAIDELLQRSFQIHACFLTEVLLLLLCLLLLFLELVFSVVEMGIRTLLRLLRAGILSWRKPKQRCIWPEWLIILLNWNNQVRTLK